MNLQDIFEAKTASHTREALIQHIRDRVGCDERFVASIDELDAEEIKYYKENPDTYTIEDGEITQKVSVTDLVWANSKEISFTIGSDLDDEDVKDFDQNFASKGFTSGKDYYWNNGYGDDMPNGFNVRNTKMLYDSDILDAVIDFTGSNCYS